MSIFVTPTVPGGMELWTVPISHEMIASPRCRRHKDAGKAGRSIVIRMTQRISCDLTAVASMRNRCRRNANPTLSNMGSTTPAPQSPPPESGPVCARYNTGTVVLPNYYLEYWVSPLSLVIFVSLFLSPGQLLC
jgi:hypothetical protein